MRLDTFLGVSRNPGAQHVVSQHIYIYIVCGVYIYICIYIYIYTVDKLVCVYMYVCIYYITYAYACNNVHT